MAKLCPFRFAPSSASGNCVKGSCALWIDGQCAIVKIAESLDTYYDDDDDDDDK